MPVENWEVSGELTVAVVLLQDRRLPGKSRKLLVDTKDSKSWSRGSLNMQILSYA